jgi:hypothetical protein
MQPRAYIHRHTCLCWECPGELYLCFILRHSDGWNIRTDVVEGNEEEALGGLSIKLYSTKMIDFDEHFWTLRPGSNSRNPWFTEFWQERFQCYVEGPDRNPNYHNRCTGNS